jgi:hypothetical protein
MAVAAASGASLGGLLLALSRSAAPHILLSPLPAEWKNTKAAVSIVSGVGYALLATATWRALETHMYTGILSRLCGLDVTSLLARVPPFLMLTRHETALLASPSLSTASGWALIGADLLLANPAQSPIAGAVGVAVYGVTLVANGFPLLPGYYLTAAVWGALAVATYAGPSAAPGKVDVALTGATVQVVHAKGAKAGSATLALPIASKRLRWVHDTLLRPGKTLDITFAAYCLAAVAALCHLGVSRPLAGYVVPWVGATSLWYHPLVLSVALLRPTGNAVHVAPLGCLLAVLVSNSLLSPLPLLVALPPLVTLGQRAWAAVWKGKAVVPNGLVGLPEEALHKAVLHFGERGRALGNRLWPPPEAA